jgi:hypothetical protein
MALTQSGQQPGRTAAARGRQVPAFEPSRERSEARRFLTHLRRDPATSLGLLIAIMLIALTLLAPVLAPMARTRHTRCYTTTELGTPFRHGHSGRTLQPFSLHGSGSARRRFSGCVLAVLVGTDWMVTA